MTAPTTATSAPAQLFTIKEAAQYLRVHPTSIRRYIAAGDLPAYRIGPSQRMGRVRASDVAALAK